jgi:alkylation response protein AidB-like acyl-CoA dehydrogenase
VVSGRTRTVAPTSSVASIVNERLLPLVARVDIEGLYPAEVLRELGTAGAYAHHTRDHGSGPSGIAAAVEAMAEAGKACLSTAFCVWCQDALSWYLDRSDNATPRGRYLAAVVSGDLLGGTGLSNPMKSLAGIEPLALKGTRVAGGYRVTGRLPFVSNIEIGHLFAGIFAIEGTSDRLVMAVFRAGQHGVDLARNAHFIALEGTATQTVLLRDAFVVDDDVLSEDARRFVPRIRAGFVLLQSGMGLGLARGAAASMRADSRGRRLAAHLPLGPDLIDDRAARISRRVVDLLSDVETPDRAVFLEALRIRLEISWLALEAAQAAMLQFGARGYLLGSEAARRLREAQFVGIVTPSVNHCLSELAEG